MYSLRRDVENNPHGTLENNPHGKANSLGPGLVEDLAHLVEHGVHLERAIRLAVGSKRQITSNIARRARFEPNTAAARSQQQRQNTTRTRA